ncbi:class I SAM-dependent RNA methyltransferase [cf. Phormidesmis sp. LEGE 11477]|uniref:THUMP domain-containing class I SAM-dependent RNA methyltransferase n=1 Tax=cf. Phormidesmis sp. LEGE 11477 TaxID=1828680 RepID=UPI00187E1A92|nr:THUMP domain-containing protein [cf. Phormidesmis sp. LEGE 11477]MBE9064794.1 RNA methyltransferase [cf. Phormidesmis sp. LEGE 11477]
MNQYFATVARGLEPLVVEELERLGAKDVQPGFCGAAFKGDRALLYKVNLWARLPFRILWRLSEFDCATGADLFAGVQRLDWSQYLTPDQTLAVTATGKTDALNHTHFTSLQVKNAIVEQQTQTLGDRSDVDTHEPDLRINVHLHKNRATLSLDSSGDSLHRRGYRPAVGAAPLKESLAAALIQLSSWQSDQAFFDPLCGSGTLPLEAGLQALRVAPGLFRERFGFETWLDYDDELWESMLTAAEEQQREDLLAFVGGSDRDPNVLIQAHSNAQKCGIEHLVNFQQNELADVEAPTDSGILLCNPPYGERLGKDTDLGAFYKLLGNVLKQRFKGWTAYILSGNKALSSNIGLKSASRTPVYNGALLCQLMKYELY